MKKAILLSGGMDSVALTYLYRDEIEIAFTVDYGQNNAKKEIEVSKKICNELQILHETITIDCTSVGSGEMSSSKTINNSQFKEWWPYRNQLLITLVSMKAILYNINEILIGTVITDKKFMDGSANFFAKINMLLAVQEGGMQVVTPALNLTTLELIKKSKIPETLLLWAHSCHIMNQPCGQCDSCRKYIEVISKLNEVST